MQKKHALIEAITPLALLKAITPEAKAAINNSYLGPELIGIWSFPFRIGRESRAKMVDGKLVVCHRIGRENVPNNDLYLIDNGKRLLISREHLTIEKRQDSYHVVDRESACGTAIGSTTVGDSGRTLQDGDLLQIGGKGSPFTYEFIQLK